MGKGKKRIIVLVCCKMVKKKIFNYIISCNSSIQLKFRFQCNFRKMRILSLYFIIEKLTAKIIIKIYRPIGNRAMRFLIYAIFAEINSIFIASIEIEITVLNSCQIIRNTKLNMCRKVSKRISFYICTMYLWWECVQCSFTTSIVYWYIHALPCDHLHFNFKFADCKMHFYAFPIQNDWLIHWFFTISNFFKFFFNSEWYEIET